MACRSRVLACCLLLAAAQIARASPDVVAAIHDSVSESLGLPQRDVVLGDLPLRRPPLPPQGWQQCDWSCIDTYTVRSAERGETRGVYTLDVRFKPLAGLTSDMMVWLFRNLHKDAIYPRTNETFPMYLLFHPVDHLHHEATEPVQVGSTFTWNEIPLTGCTYDRDSATAPWVCPRLRRGFVRKSPRAAWSTKLRTKVNMTLTRFDKGGIEFISREFVPISPGELKRTVATTRHTWSDSADGLLLRTEQWLGVMAPGENTQFDDSMLASAVNRIVQATYMADAWNVPNSNVTAAAYMAVLHYTQEYASLPLWLPQLYQGRI